MSKQLKAMPIYEECSWIKIPTASEAAVVEFVNSKEIPNKVFVDAGAAFCEQEAECRLRVEFRNIEEDENVVNERALAAAEAYGDILYEILCDDGLLDNDHISETIEKYFKNDFKEDELEDE